MNYMPKVLEILGVEVGEKFNIKPLIGNPYHFDEDCILVNKNGHNVDDDKIIQILIGACEIEKLPWKPKDGELFFSITTFGDYTDRTWRSCFVDYALYNTGNCFRTHEEITDEIKQRILSEMKGKYEND